MRITRDEKAKGETMVHQGTGAPLQNQIDSPEDCKIRKCLVGKAKEKQISEQKIPSEMEVALRYKVPVHCLLRLHCHTVNTVQIVYIASTSHTVTVM